MFDWLKKKSKPVEGDLVTELANASVSRFIESGASALTPMERLLVAIWGLEADVNNGGFDQYYFNSYGYFAAETPSLLRAIGADQAATLVERANAAFGPDGPPSDRDKRQEAWERIAEAAADWDALDRQFFAYPDDLESLLKAYVTLHIGRPEIAEAQARLSANG